MFPPTCPSRGHIMKVTDGAGYEGYDRGYKCYKSFICNICGKSGAAERWWCCTCSNDVCFACHPVPPKPPASLPSRPVNLATLRASLAAVPTLRRAVKVDLDPYMSDAAALANLKKEFGPPRPPSPAEVSAPAVASRPPLNPVVRVLLIGAKDRGSSLSTITRMGLLAVVGYLRDLWALDIAANGTFAVIVGTVAGGRFPTPTGIHVNMMPFILGNKASVPKELHHYWPIVEQCVVSSGSKDELGKVGYLTVMESLVTGGASQRRAGLHTEGGYALADAVVRRVTHGAFKEGAASVNIVRGSDRGMSSVSWGGGRVVAKEATFSGDALVGGVFMASSVGGTCRVWNGQVKPEGIGPLGDIEALRGTLGPGRVLRDGEILWLTDLTPHESLPLPPGAGSSRSYFRLCTASLSVWYEAHSTPSPLGVVPGPEVVIIKGDKFEGTANPLGISSLGGGCGGHLPWSFGTGAKAVYLKAAERAEEEEYRVDPADGGSYTKAAFIEEYGGTVEWDAAFPLEPHVSLSPLSLTSVSSMAASSSSSSSAAAAAVADGLTFEGSLMHGWMRKRGAVVRNWKDRFFILKGQRLFYFVSSGADVPKGCVDLSNSAIVVRDLEPGEITGYPTTPSFRPGSATPFYLSSAFCVVTPARTWEFVASGAEAKTAWMKAIRSSVAGVSAGAGNPPVSSLCDKLP